ncbi:MAG: hypothetical protein OXF09_02000 [Hyphomicrobiales bacterium]|nr:hypothetical protein [Hyphomicrobiales bacterium]
MDIHLEMACLQNPGETGRGVVLSGEGTYKKIPGGDPKTTHNQMCLIVATTAICFGACYYPFLYWIDVWWARL